MKKDVTVRSSAAEYLTFITASGESQVEATFFVENGGKYFTKAKKP